MTLSRRRLVITCEHASNRVPARWARPFGGHDGVLESHRGWDPGARAIARGLAARFGAPLALGQVTRLLVDLNRSLHNPSVFSSFARELSSAERAALVDRYWRPHRAAVDGFVERALATHPRREVLHLAVHSFTPALHGRTRNADVGLLYVPSRAAEAEVARALAASLTEALPSLRVRFNYPYRGASDGLGRALRERFGDRLASLALEVNHGALGTPLWMRLVRALGEALEPLVSAQPSTSSLSSAMSSSR